MTSTSIAVSQTQSLAAIRNFVRASVSCITYARGLCNDSAFESKPFLGFELKHMVPKTLEAKTLSEWIEKGAFDALNRGFLKEMSLCVYNPDCSELLESYCFSFVYNKDKQRAALGLSSQNFLECKSVEPFDTSTLPFKETRCWRAAKCGINLLSNVHTSSTSENREKYYSAVDSTNVQAQMSEISAQFGHRSKEQVQKMLAALMSRLLEVVESLPPLLTERVLTMRLTYYDEFVPTSFEPPCFAPATNHMIKMYQNELTHNVELGIANTGHHVFTIAVRHPLLASIHNRLKSEHRSFHKCQCTDDYNHKHCSLKEKCTLCSHSSHKAHLTNAPSYRSSDKNDNVENKHVNLNAAITSSDEDKSVIAAATAVANNVDHAFLNQREHNYISNMGSFNSTVKHVESSSPASIVCTCECTSSNEVLNMTNIRTLRELMAYSEQGKLMEYAETLHGVKELITSPNEILLQEEEQQSLLSFSPLQTVKYRLIDIAYLLLVCFAFTKSPALTNGRGSFTSNDLDEYLNNSCPLGLSSTQSLHVMNKLVEEFYLTEAIYFSGDKNKSITKMQGSDIVINSSLTKVNNSKPTNKNCSNSHIYGSNYKVNNNIKNGFSITNTDVMIFEQTAIKLNEKDVVQWTFLEDPPYEIVKWLLSQRHVMELLSPSHYEMLIKLKKMLEKKRL